MCKILVHLGSSGNSSMWWSLWMWGWMMGEKVGNGQMMNRLKFYVKVFRCYAIEADNLLWLPSRDMVTWNRERPKQSNQIWLKWLRTRAQGRTAIRKLFGVCRRKVMRYLSKAVRRPADIECWGVLNPSLTLFMHAFIECSQPPLEKILSLKTGRG